MSLPPVNPDEQNFFTGPQVQSLIDDARKSIYDELIKKFAAWVIAAGLGLLSLAALGGWFVLKPILFNAIGGVPRGAVVAFDRDDFTVAKCEEGWTPFEPTRARVIVGVGKPAESYAKSENDDVLKSYNFGQTGGEQTHKLTIGEMPKHSHGGAFGNGDGGVALNSDHNVLKPGGHSTTEVGGDQPHNIMPPFIALYFCKKD